MFIDILEFTIGNIKNVQGKLFCKCGLRFNQKFAYVSTKLLLEKSAKTKKKKKTMKTFTTFYGFQGQNQFFWQISETTFSKQFSQKKFSLLYTLDSKMFRNMCKLRCKVRNGKNLPHEIRILQTICFKVTSRTIQAMFPVV